MSSISLSPEGIQKLATLIKQKRGEMSLPQFGEIVGLSYVTIWKIELKERNKLQMDTLAALAPVLGYSMEELTEICTGKKNPLPPPKREFLTAEDVLPIIHQLPPDEKKRLREIDLDTMSNKELIAAMQAVTDAVKRRLGV